LQEALRVNKTLRQRAFNPDDIPCLKIFVKVNRRIVPIDADKSEQYLAFEDFKSDQQRDRIFSKLEEQNSS
jgi:hypothetical protein